MQLRTEHQKPPERLFPAPTTRLSARTRETTSKEPSGAPGEPSGISVGMAHPERQAGQDLETGASARRCPLARAAAQRTIHAAQATRYNPF